MIPTTQRSDAPSSDLGFQSRNRETYDSNAASSVRMCSVSAFQSRNRETYDSNYRQK